MNPHERNAHKILSLARLPVPTLPHIAFRRDQKSLRDQIFNRTEIDLYEVRYAEVSELADEQD